jgi:hypothetical protein
MRWLFELIPIAVGLALGQLWIWLRRVYVAHRCDVDQLKEITGALNAGFKAGTEQAFHLAWLRYGKRIEALEESVAHLRKGEGKPLVDIVAEPPA